MYWSNFSPTMATNTAKNDLLFWQLHLLPELQLWHGFKGWCNVSPLWQPSMGNVGNAALIWTSFLSSCFMQLVSNPKVNHPEPLSLQVVCNQGNHSLWFKQVRYVWVLDLCKGTIPLLCIALIWWLSKLPSPCSNFSCSCTPCVYCPLLAATRDILVNSCNSSNNCNCQNNKRFFAVYRQNMHAP